MLLHQNVSTEILIPGEIYMKCSIFFAFSTSLKHYGDMSMLFAYFFYCDRK